MSRATLLWPSWGLILGLGGCGSGSVDAAAQALPNGPAKRVVLITCDSLRVDRMGVYGYARPTTPHIDAFAKECITFTNAWSTSPSTLPALASLLSGRLPNEIGVTTDADTAMSPEVTTIAEVARDAGFATAAVVSNGVLRDLRAGQGDVGVQQGFQFYDANMPPSPAGHGLTARDGLDTTAAAVRWLGEETRPNADRFFLWVHYSDPHGPYTPSSERLAAFQRDHADETDLPVGETDSGMASLPRYMALEGVRKAGEYLDRYDAEVHAFDEAVGLLLKALADRGWLDSTLVVLTADHGVSIGEHAWWFSHGETIQRELVRVPLIVKPPQVLSEALSVRDGRKNGKLVMHLDVLPTVVAAIGAKGPPVRGISLLQDRLPEDRIALQMLDRGGPNGDMLGITDGRFRLVSKGMSYPVLYDTLVDPLETKSVLADNPRVADRLRARWLDFVRGTNSRGKPISQ